MDIIVWTTIFNRSLHGILPQYRFTMPTRILRKEITINLVICQKRYTIENSN